MDVLYLTYGKLGSFVEKKHLAFDNKHQLF